jgi:hypothetical protein
MVKKAPIHKKPSRMSMIEEEEFSTATHAEELEFYAQHMHQSTGFKLEKLKKHFFLKGNRMGVNFEHLLARDAEEGGAASTGCQRHQILRSASMWSLGLEEGQNEHSILNAYIALICQAK